MPVYADGNPEEIIVTARRRAETIEDVPMAVSAVARKDLRQWQASSLADVQMMVPNLNLVQTHGTSSGATVFIRGIGQPDSLHTFDPGVGIYLDTVYVSRVQGALFKLSDVERIEVLRGPQGTLYGKNTIGGAIRIITRTPDLDNLTGNAELTYGRFDRLDASAYLSGPIIEDKLAFSLSALSSNRDGTVTDRTTGKRYNDDNSDVIRAKILAKPSDSLSLTLSGDYTRENTALTLGRAEADLRTIGGALVNSAPSTGYDHSGRTSFDNDEGQNLKHWGLSLTVDGDIGGGFSFVSITAYRDLHPDSYLDTDNSEYELADTRNNMRQHQVSQEFQLKYAGDRLDAVLGLYYHKERSTTYTEATADQYVTFQSIPLSFTGIVNDEHLTHSYAAFGQATWRATDALSITAGLRFSHDRKSFHRHVQTFQGAPLDIYNYDFVLADDSNWDAWTPSLSLDYRWSNNLMTYLSASRGYKSGGLNGRANTKVELRPYAPEYVWSYEAGVKANWFDGRLKMNGDIFFNDYNNFQATVADILRNTYPLPVFSFPVLNAASMETYGAELELIANPLKNLNLYATIGYLRANYISFKDARGDRSDDHPAFAPKWTMRYAADYTAELGAQGNLTFMGEASYKAKHWLSVDNRDVLTQDGYWLFNAGVRYTPVEGSWHLAAQIKNIGGRIYKTDAQEFSGVANIQSAFYGDPLTWTISAGYQF